jgi:peptide/nickel transport system permease protein
MTTHLPPPEVELGDIADIAEPAGLPPGAEPAARSNWQLFRRRFFRHKMAVVSIVIIILLFIVCLGAHWVAPYPKNQAVTDVIGAHGPSAKHWMGTTEASQDQLSQILYGGQVSLKIGLGVAFFSTLFGVLVGAFAGYYGKWIDQGLSRLTDLFLIIPELAILAVALERLGHTVNWIIIVLAALGWMYLARIVRGLIFSIKEKEFVEAARAAGASDRRIIVRHILPNCIGPIMVYMTLAIAIAVLAEATLSFLGFGLQIPATSWGLLLKDAEPYTTNPDKFYLIFFPSLMLIITVMCFNFLGDGLRDAFDPQSKH